MRNKRGIKILALHAAVVAAVAVYLLLLRGGCLWRMAFGVPCPTCGITRAYLSALSGDLSGAFARYPLFLFVPVLVLFALHAGKLAGGRRTKFTVNAAIVGGAVLVAADYAMRLAFHIVQ